MKADILQSLSYGMYALGVQGEQRPSASIVNTVFQVTASPAVIAVSVNLDNYSNECIKKNGIFTVSVLSEDTSGAVIGALGFTSGRDSDKLRNVSYKMLMEGVPVVKENSCCWFLCKVTGSVDVHTHTVFIAEIIAGSDHMNGKPMTYDYYHTVIKGSAPKNAPTYQPPVKTVSEAESYICPICGFVYNGNDPTFGELPDDYVCPICRAPKSAFKRKV